MLLRKSWTAPRQAGFRAAALLCAASLCAASLLVGGPAQAVQSADDALEKASKLAEQQHWAEARDAYDKVRDGEQDWRSPRMRRAVEGAVACCMKLSLWEDALKRAQQFVDRTAGSFEEAVGRRFLAGLYMNVPHEGTKRGGEYLRGQWGQGVYISSWKKDRRAAIENYEKARDLLARLAGEAARGGPDVEARRKEILAERIGVNFDLAAALARRGSHQYGYGYWDWWWGWAPEDEEESDAVEDADYEEPRWGRFGRWGFGEPAPPTGIPLGPDGKPQFIKLPQAYAAALGDGPKIRYLLDEIQKLDTTEEKDDAALALLRWAMICRTLYGPDSVNAWNPYQPAGAAEDASDAQRPMKKTWELADDEAITWVGGRVQLVALPPEESPITILRVLEEQYPRSKVLPEAHYARALYFQTRQQFPQAAKEYEDLIRRHADHRRAGHARQQLGYIRQADATLSATGVYLPDSPPKLKFTYRNAERIDFTAREIDLLRFVREQMERGDQNYWAYRNIQWSIWQDDVWKKYVTRKDAGSWSETVPRLPDHRAAEGVSNAPLTKPGAYVVEARPAGSDDSSLALVLVTDIAVVHKNLPQRGLIYVCDARTGRPLPETAVRVYEHWNVYEDNKHSYRWRSGVETANEDGVVEYTRREGERGSAVDALVAGKDGRIAISFFQYWNENPDWRGDHDGRRVYVITDRPVYRPGHTVQFRAWVRDRAGGEYQPPREGQQHEVVIRDAKGNEVFKERLKTDRHGGLHGTFTLGAEPPLGMYQIQVDGQGDGYYVAGGSFRVEEYRKPEFEVTVTPSATQARLGEKVKARIEAKYYYGAPVAGGQATFKVFRETYHHVYFGAAEYDWLYGRGYGFCQYAYPWLPWWGRWGRFICGPAPYPGYYDEDWRGRIGAGTRKALRELVSQGAVPLGPDGTYEIEFDTDKAKRELPNDDHRYTVEVDVRDASRRTISGSGSVIVTRQSFYAFIEADRGWYGRGDPVGVEVRTVTPDNLPVSAKGELTLARIRYGGASNTEVTEEVLHKQAAETDADGRFAASFATAGGGQYRVTFRTKDDAGEDVLGNAVFWVGGPDFDGTVYRFNELEVIADKRTYQPGETAHLLVNTGAADSRVLLSEDVRGGVLNGYRFIDVPLKSTVVDVPIREGHTPNFFVEATLVRGGRIFSEQRELFVPPAKRLLSVALKTDKDTYQPGEKGRVEVAVTDSAGKPVQGALTITAFDESITYIQEETAPSPKAHLHGQRRQSYVATDWSGSHEFQAHGDFLSPESLWHLNGEPEGWQGTWGVELYGLELRDEVKQERTRRVGGAGGGFFAGRGIGSGMLGQPAAAAEGRAEAKTAATQPPASPAAAPMHLLVMKTDSQISYGFDLSGLALPELRTNFADTALWAPLVELREDGTADVEIAFPQSLTSWRVRGYAFTDRTQVGDAVATATTKKNLLVRLQSPRFFVERDEVVLSANVHNYLPSEKEVTAELIVPGDLLEPLDAGPHAEPGSVVKDKDGRVHLFARRNVKSGGEHRFDWPVRVKKAGLAAIAVRALTDVESDGMQMAFPVLVHGVSKTLAAGGSYRVSDAGEREIELALPDEIDPEQTKLEITLSPSLAGVMIDALPYLAGYPYGCVEQTMSRFYPSVLVRHTLRQMNIDLKTIAQQRRQMFEADLKNRFGRWTDSPVFDDAELDRMVKAGLDRIYAMQQPDGGWGWWKEDSSSPFQTAYVMQGLHAARLAGLNVDAGVYDRGLSYLATSVAAELERKEADRRLGGWEMQAYLAYILSLEKRLGDENMKKWLTRLFGKRGEMTNHGRAQLALALHHDGQAERAATLLRNVLQFVERDDSNETAWVRTPQQGWWFWWNNDIETNAWTLKALATMDPRSDLAPRLVKWLLNNRKNGHYWRSTRDTAQVIAAMVDYMKASGEAAPDCTVTVLVGGEAVREVKVTKDNFFTFDNRVALHGLQVRPGPQRITIRKTGAGALYYSAYLSFFTKEEDVKGAGNEIFVRREYFKLTPRTQSVGLPDPGGAATPPAGRPDPLSSTGRTEDRAVYTREPLKLGDAVRSGDLVEVVLTIESKNTCDFLAFEDFKPAGCEPVEVRSGGRWAGGLCANVELRDEKVVFFIGLLEQGRHVLRYKLRAETPGHFHALPTVGFAMYAPEVRAISDEMRLGVGD